MFRQESTQWSLHGDASIGINFCVWVLIADGLKVFPFDVHPTGDGKLQALGLNEQMWRSWFTETVLGQRSPANPSLALIGTPSLRQRLQELWADYLPVANVWRRSAIGKSHLLMSSSVDGKTLWHDLLPFQHSLPSLRIYYVDYPRVVSTVVPSVSVVLGLGGEDQSSSFYRRDYRDHILRAAKKLSKNP